jgi:5-methylthioadenosine/S-adenosylhomocysteine deaminase
MLRAGLVVPDAANDAIADGAVLIEQGRVVSVGPYRALRRAYPLAREHGREGLLAIPGLVDAHSHGRGLPLAAQGIEDAPFELLLARLTACTPLPPRDDALVAAADLLATGVTAVQVFVHTFTAAEVYRDHARATAEGLARSGIDFELVLGITDRDEFVPPGTAPDVSALVRPERGLNAAGFFAVVDSLAEEWRRQPTLGPVAPQWCSEAIWREAAARGVRVHTHLLESEAQRAAYGSALVETLDRVGVLDERLSVAHGVWLAPEEISLLAKRGVTIVHCPGSNVRLRVGTAPVDRWLRAGARVALGLDSNTASDPPDAFAELRLARALAAELGAPLSAREVFALATAGGAAALGRTGELGALVPGAEANVVLVRVTAAPDEDPLEALVERARRRDVREVWARGGLLVEGGRLRNAGEAAAARRRLHARLRRDADARRRRLTELASVEPWLKRVWQDTVSKGRLDPG